MLSNLAHILQKDEAEIRRIIERLEAFCGGPNEDIRLFNEVNNHAKSKLKSLGLDENDTTAAELEAALTKRLEKDMEKFQQAVLGSEIKSSDQLNKLLVDLVSVLLPSTWALKKNSAKHILENTPPKKVMKLLGYRSINSMLKREEVSKLYALASVIESKAWQSNFWKNHTKLTATDFEKRQIELHAMPAGTWGDMHQKAGLVSCILPLGTAILWPMPRASLSKGLYAAVLILEATECLKHYSSAIKLEQMNPDFGQKILELMVVQPPSPLKIDEHSLNWHSLHKHCGLRPDENLSQMFDGVFEADDFHPWSISRQMAKLHPTFSWWAENESLAWHIGAQTISLNLQDNVARHLGLAEASSWARNLWSELICRYLHHQTLDQRQMNLNRPNNRLNNQNQASGKNFSLPKLAPELIQAEFA